MANFVLVLAVELVSLPVFGIFYNVQWAQQLWQLMLVLALATWGLTVIGTIFSALTVNIRLREVMLPMLTYPILVPALMGAMRLTAILVMGKPIGGDDDRVAENADRLRRDVHRRVVGIGGNGVGGVEDLCVTRFIYALRHYRDGASWRGTSTRSPVPAGRDAAGRDLQDHLLPRARGHHRDARAPSWRSSRSVLFLITKNFKFDALAVAVTEVGLAFLAANLVTGSIWGRHDLGHLVDLGRAPHLGAGLLAAVRRLPDAAQRDRGADAARDLRRGVLDLRVHRRADRDLLDQVVAHAAPAPVFWGGGSFPPDWTRTSSGTCWRWCCSASS